MYYENGKKQKARPKGVNLKVRWRAKVAMRYCSEESAHRAILVWECRDRPPRRGFLGEHSFFFLKKKPLSEVSNNLGRRCRFQTKAPSFSKQSFERQWPETCVCRIPARCRCGWWPQAATGSNARVTSLRVRALAAAWRASSFVEPALAARGASVERRVRGAADDPVCITKTEKSRKRGPKG